MSTEVDRLHLERTPPAFARRAPLLPESYYWLGGAGRSAAILSSVENRVRRLERSFGLERLLRTIASISHEDRALHVARYRTLIRTREWPNQPRPTSLEVFLDEFLQSCVVYVEVAFEILDSVAQGTKNFGTTMQRRTLASEALRGQFGKRCVTGLDARLSMCEIELQSRLFDAAPHEATDAALDLLCTPVAPDTSAEVSLLEDFAEARTHFPEPPTIEEIVSADPSRQEAIGRVLRRYTRWSVSQLQKLYHEFDEQRLNDHIVESRRLRSNRSALRLKLVAEISKRCSPKAVIDIIQLARAVTVLNHINLAVEPSYSFKGGPGLAHGIAFNIAQTPSCIPQFNYDQIVDDKWALFAETKDGDLVQ